MPFATILLIALVAVMGLYVLYSFGLILLQAISDGSVILHNAGVLIDYTVLNLVFDVIANVIQYAVLLFDDLLILGAAIICSVMVILMLLKKRNLLLFIPTLIMTCLFALIAAYAALDTLIDIIVGIPSVIGYIYQALAYEIYIVLLNPVTVFFNSIKLASNTLAFSAVTVAWLALAFLFISCGKGVVGIFKRAKRPCFIIFCAVLVICAAVVSGDIIITVIQYIESAIQHTVWLIGYAELWNAMAYIANITHISIIIDHLILPIFYRLLDPRIMLNVLSLVTVFATGFWLYKPYRPVKKAKKKEIDLVDYVELEYGDNSEVTMEVIDGDNDDEFVNISVHRQKDHDE